MPVTQVEQHHRLTYNNSVTMVAQQMTIPIVETVTTMPASGEAMSASDLVAPGEYAYGEDRARRNPELPVVGTRRWLIRPEAIESGGYIDEEDKFDMATDPTSTFVKVHTQRVIRGRQDRILGVRRSDAGVYTVTDGGILGNAIEGKRPGSSGTALPAGQIIAVGGTGLTLDKLRTAKLTLQQADFGIDDDDPLYGLISPKQSDDLLAIAVASGAALNAFAIDQLIMGKPTPLMGIKWILSNRVPKDSAGNWLVPIWSKRNIVEGVWQEIQGDMWNDTAAKNKPYVYVSTRRDVVRLQDKGVVAITCNV